MAAIYWDPSDTTEVAQIETFTLNNDFNDSETAVAITITKEDGSTTAVSITPSGTDESAIAATLQAALAASTDAEFQKITWTVATTVVTGTANTAGIPFSAASSVTGGTGTITDNVSTANAGKYDYGTAANWSGAAVPVNSDDVYISGSYSILYGLQQSSVSLTSLSVSNDFTGSLGDKANGYELETDATTVTLEGRGSYQGFHGTATNVYVRALRPGSTIALDGTITNLRLLGGMVRGEITIADAADVTNIYSLGTGSRLTVGENVTSFALLEMDGGEAIVKSSVTNSQITNARLEFREAAAVGTAMTLRGQTYCTYNSSGTMAKLTMHGGVLDFSRNPFATVTCSDGTMNGGLIKEGGGATVTWTSLDVYGGRVETAPGSALDSGI